ncbi:MAG: magnesium/cobalt transporter CorA [Acidaminococcaceae bacterium]
MYSRVDKISDKIGLPPGSPVPVGIDDSSPSKFLSTIIGENRAATLSLSILTADVLQIQPQSTLWIDVQGLASQSSIQNLFTAMDVHPLLQEDLLNTKHHPKFEALGGNLLILVKKLTITTKLHVQADQIGFVLGPNYILTFQPPNSDCFQAARARMSALTYPRSHSGYIFYMLLDNLIDSHFVILEKLHDRIEWLETRLLTQNEAPPQEDILKLKHDVALVRRSIVPLRKIMNELRLPHEQYFLPTIEPYLRDLADHVEQLVETCDICHDALATIVQLNLDNINMRTNEIMKTLALISTVFLPLTFLAGLYGMNFEYMPELKSEYGYPVCITVMAIIAIYLYRGFKAKNWL